MNLVEKILALYPELTIQDFGPITGTIQVWENPENKELYIKAWNHPTLAQPTKEQLDGISS